MLQRMLALTSLSISLVVAPLRHHSGLYLHREAVTWCQHIQLPGAEVLRPGSVRVV